MINSMFILGKSIVDSIMMSYGFTKDQPNDTKFTYQTGDNKVTVSVELTKMEYLGYITVESHVKTITLYGKDETASYYITYLLQHYTTQNNGFCNGDDLEYVRNHATKFAWFVVEVFRMNRMQLVAAMIDSMRTRFSQYLMKSVTSAEIENDPFTYTDAQLNIMIDYANVDMMNRIDSSDLFTYQNLIHEYARSLIK